MNNLVEETYFNIRNSIENINRGLVPIFRRTVRFVALPYCYIYYINWEECKKNKIQVACDLLYIFFKYKYFPDNYSLCRLWEINRNMWKFYYGSNYEPYQRYRLQKEVQRQEFKIIFDNKDICHQICLGMKLPVPKQYLCIKPSENYRDLIKGIFRENGSRPLIIKPVGGAGGRGICLARIADDKSSIEIINQDHTSVEVDDYVLGGPAVVQEVVTQEETLSRISSSLNTVRIVTLLTKKNEVLIIGALMRFGVNGSFVDNTSRGGVAIGVNVETGELHKKGVDFNSKIHEKHPTSGFRFQNFQVPFWESVKQLAIKVQTNFYFYKLLGLDIGISVNGPVLIEINPDYDNVGLEQSCGPILANQVVREEFSKYQLLINREFI